MNKLIDRLSVIQQTLKAPKGQYNKFGKYNYRNCEDILEAVKPTLGPLAMYISDEIVMLGDRFYVKATVTITDGENLISNTGFAREAITKKGMDESQITGAASSYARKYALNGLFCIDDTKDADSFDNTASKTEKKPTVNLVEIAKECGWGIDQVINSFNNPSIKTVADIANPEACAEFLRANKI